MRSNGLTAPAYTPVADLDPRVAVALLVDLKVEGIAAYISPIEPTSVAGFDRPEFRIDVKERLYVDTAASARVRDLLGDKDPTLLDDNDDLTWAQIVAGFDQPVDARQARWPANEDVDWSAHGSTVEASDPSAATADDAAPDLSDGADLEADDTDSQSGQEDAGRGRWTSRRGSGGRRSGGRASYDEDRYIPPPPPPLPKLDPIRQFAWIGVIGGPAVLLLAGLFAITLPGWLMLLAIGGFVGGFITLVVLMGDGSDDDPDPGNGAVV